MKSADDPSQHTQSPVKGPSLPVSRRNVLITGSAIAGMLSATGVSSATPDEASMESMDSSETCHLTITVTGLEVDGPMADVGVTIGDETQTTDTSGQVVFEVGDGTHKVTVEKERWGSITKTIEMNGQHQEMHIPMHIEQYNDLTITVCDTSLGTPIRQSTITVDCYGTVRTDETGTAMVMIERMLEPTTHDLMVAADGYHTETRHVTMANDKQLRIELLPE